MPIDPRNLRPSELCRLLNSTPLGEVINERQLYRHRTKAGFRIGQGRHIDMFRYLAWLVHTRQELKSQPQVGPVLVRRFASLLGVSRQGLSRAELVGVIEPDDPLGNVAALERLLRPYLMRRGELFDFHHGQFREAVQHEYLLAELDSVETHRQLADYFHEQLCCSPD